MYSKINQYFQAEINGVRISKEQLFYSVDFLLNNMEDRFPNNKREINNPEFIRDFVNALDNTYFSTGAEITLSELEHELQVNINTAQTFNEVEFNIEGYGWLDINQKIQSGSYLPNLEKIIATDDTIQSIVEQEILRLGYYADLNHIDVSQVTDMSDLFRYSQFNGDISCWDVSNVKYMEAMFYESEFNNDISKWDVSNVQNMSHMFQESPFNGNISNWNVSNVRSMRCMFCNSQFEGDISCWDVSNVMEMSYMLADSPFNGDISKWRINPEAKTTNIGVELPTIEPDEPEMTM